MVSPPGGRVGTRSWGVLGTVRPDTVGVGVENLPHCFYPVKGTVPEPENEPKSAKPLSNVLEARRIGKGLRVDLWT